MASLTDLLLAIQSQNNTLQSISANISYLANVMTPGVTPTGMGGGMGLGGKMGGSRQAVGMIQSAASIMGGTMSSMGYSRTAFGGMGSALEGMGNIADMMGPAGPVAGAVFKLAGGLIKSVDALNSWTRHLMDSDFKLANLSPSMMAVKATQDIRDIMFQMKMGERLARSTGELSEAFSHLRETTFGLDSGWKITMNELGTKLLHAADRLIYWLDTGKDLAKTKAYQNMFKKDPTLLDADELEKSTRAFWEQTTDPFAGTDDGGGGIANGLAGFGNLLGLGGFVGGGMRLLDRAEGREQ
jgi:hypothetical protein